LLSSLVKAIKRNSELRDPKFYKIAFIAEGTLMGDIVGEGWYIITTDGPTVGPITSRQAAEDLLIAALEQVNGKPFSEEEKAMRRAYWIK